MKNTQINNLLNQFQNDITKHINNHEVINWTEFKNAFWELLENQLKNIFKALYGARDTLIKYILVDRNNYKYIYERMEYLLNNVRNIITTTVLNTLHTN